MLPMTGCPCAALTDGFRHSARKVHGASADSAPKRLLRSFPHRALRLHAATRAYVPNVHQTIRDPSALLGFHRPITARTSHNGKLAHLALLRFVAAQIKK